MRMAKAKGRSLACLLGLCMALSVALGALPGMTVAKALDTNTQMTYPFATGETAFRYAPTFTSVTEQGTGEGYWDFIQVNFDVATYDFTDVDYVAVQIRVDKGNPGITTGLLENGDRYNNSTDGNKYYFLSEAGTITELEILYNAVWLGENACGTLLMPINQMSWQWNNNQSDLSKVSAYYFTTNTASNWNWAITIGDVGVYKGEPGQSKTTFEKLADCSAGERGRSAYYVDSSNPDCMKFPSEAGTEEPEPPAFAYPFRTGTASDLYAAAWQGPALGDSADNWQTLKVRFDSATVDFSSASYLVIQYYGASGAPGITFGLQKGGARYSVGASSADGQPVYFAVEGSDESVKAANIANGAVTSSVASKMGAMIIPMTSMGWQFGDEADQDLSAIESLILTTNSRYNYNYRIIVGEIGLYTGEAGSGTFTKLLDLSEDKSAKFTISSDLSENCGTLSFITPDRERMGDTTIDIKGEGKQNSSYTQSGSTGNVLINGSYGTLEIVQDTYGDDAMRITATGITGDGYTAITLSDGEDIDWAGMKGVSFWAKNDSDIEVAFNLEIDCKVANGASSRFNILQGNRIWLYDVNTGKTSIYMSRPTAVLPVGFEGWVRIPFTAFERASWSSGVSKEQFMGEGSVVSYFGITIEASKNLNKSFTINNIGAYTVTPVFSSAFVDAGGKTIPELMGLV